MRIRVQRCWAGNSKHYYRALVCGGLRIAVEEGETWNRSVASRMLDLLAVEIPVVPRQSIRFLHV